MVKAHDIYARFRTVVLSRSGRWFAEVRTYKVEQEIEKHEEMKGFLQTIFIFSAVLATGKFKLLLYDSPQG